MHVNALNKLFVIVIFVNCVCQNNLKSVVGIATYWEN